MNEEELRDRLIVGVINAIGIVIVFIILAAFYCLLP